MTLTEARAAVRAFADPADAVFVRAEADDFGKGAWGPPTIKEHFSVSISPRATGVACMQCLESPSLEAAVEAVRQQVMARKALEFAKTAPAVSVDAATADMGCAASLAAPGAGEGASHAD